MTAFDIVGLIGAVLMLGGGPNVPAAHAACVLELAMAAAVPLVFARHARLIPVALVLSAGIAVSAVGAVSEVRSVAFSCSNRPGDRSSGEPNGPSTPSSVIW